MLTSLFLVALMGVYGRREVSAWVHDSRLMVLSFASALEAGRWE